jgi:hypothetical protein
VVHLRQFGKRLSAFAPIPVVDWVAGAGFRTCILLAEQRSSGEREVVIWPEFVYPILRRLLRHMVPNRSRSDADRLFLASMTHLIIDYSGGPNKKRNAVNAERLRGELFAFPG